MAAATPCGGEDSGTVGARVAALGRRRFFTFLYFYIRLLQSMGGCSGGRRFFTFLYFYIRLLQSMGGCSGGEEVFYS